jgi:hypothetical protein
MEKALGKFAICTKWIQFFPVFFFNYALGRKCTREYMETILFLSWNLEQISIFSTA